MDAVKEIEIPLASVTLGGRLRIPERPIGLVVFVHGSGSSRFSRRNNFVAESFFTRGLATLLFDLLTSEEERIDNETRHLRFDIPLLANRLEMTSSWVQKQANLKDLRVAYFGASTGAAAAIISAANLVDKIVAVVSRGGRPDLAGEALHRLMAPVLLIAGGDDEVVLDLNKSAMGMMMKAPCELVTIAHATHLFEEPGTLEQVADLAGQWLVKQFTK